MKRILTTVFILVMHSLAYGEVTCKFNKVWQPYNKVTESFIGRYTYGFGQETKCLDAVAKTSGVGVCNWNGKGYSTYDESGGILGPPDVSYSNIDTCTNTLSDHHNGMLCLWNTKSWQPYSLKLRGFIGRYQLGALNRKDCLEWIMGSKEGLICSWNGKHEKLYSESSPSSPVVPLTFARASYCNDFIDKTKNKIDQIKDYEYSELIQYYSNVSKPHPGYTLAQCHDEKRSYHLVKTDAKGKVLDRCIPDTLYSWGDYGKAIWYRDNYGPRSNWLKPLPQELYLTQSPLGTFAYGDIALRVKLVKNLKVRLIVPGDKRIYCKDLSDQEKKDTLIIRQWDNGHGTGLDYILCSFGPVESWSMGQEEHYDEILREWAWVENNNYKDYELYYKQNGIDQLWGTVLDGHTFSRDKFYQNLRIFRQMVDLEMGWLFGASQEEHFKTRKPIYFNPD